MGEALNLKVFAIIILGGLGSLPGAIVGGFAIGDLSNVGSGSLNFGSNSSTIAEVGGETITETTLAQAEEFLKTG